MKKYKEQVRRKNNKYSLGYEYTYIFNSAYIEALKTNKLISKDQYERWMDSLTKEFNGE